MTRHETCNLKCPTKIGNKRYFGNFSGQALPLHLRQATVFGFFTFCIVVSGCTHSKPETSSDPHTPVAELQALSHTPPAVVDSGPKPQFGAARPSEPYQGTSRALLIGCTKYDYLSPESSLRGPLNDVVLM